MSYVLPAVVARLWPKKPRPSIAPPKKALDPLCAAESIPKSKPCKRKFDVDQEARPDSKLPLTTMLACAKTDPLHKDNASAATCAPFFQVRAMNCLLLCVGTGDVGFVTRLSRVGGSRRIGRRL